MIVRDLLDYQTQIKVSDLLKHSAWTYTLASSVAESRICWCVDLMDSEIYQTLEPFVSQQVPGVWQTKKVQGIAQTVRQPYILNETEQPPVETLTVQYHPLETWDTQWLGATTIDGDRVEYVSNTLIAWPSYLPVTQEAPQTDNILRMVIQFELERRF